MHLAKLSAIALCKRTDGDTQCLRMEKKKLFDSNCHACACTHTYTNLSNLCFACLLSLVILVVSVTIHIYTIHDHI